MARANHSPCSISKASQSAVVGGSGWDEPWYKIVPSGTVARKAERPLWLSEDPHRRMAEWMELKMWNAFSAALASLGVSVVDERDALAPAPMPSTTQVAASFVAETGFIVAV